jgi:hypothetical protein
MTTILILLFFVVYASPVFFCAGLEQFALAPIQAQANEKLMESQFAKPSLAHPS